MAKRLELPKFQAFTDAAPFLSGGKVYTYEAGTSTLKASYTTPAGDVENANPVILDTRGAANIYLKGSYKINILDEDDVQVTGWPVDNVEGGLGEGAMDDFYYPDATATDQGLTGNSDTIKYAVDTIGSDSGTIYLRHDGGAATTTYTLTTSETIPANIKLIKEEGAILDGAGTLTLDNPWQIDVGPSQKIFGASITVVFTNDGPVIPEWWGVDGTGASESAAEMLRCITAANGNEILLTGTYLFSGMGSLDAIAVNVRIRGVSGATIDGDGTGDLFRITGAIDYFECRGLIFTDVGGRVVSGETGTVLDKFVFDNNEIKDSESGVSLGWVVKNVHACDNIITNLSRSTSINGLHFGYNTYASQDLMEKFIVCRNRITDLQSTGVDVEVHAIIVYGREAIIKDNIIDTVYNNASSTSGAEAIYVKCRYTIVEGNILTSCGDSTNGAISVKGSARGAVTSPQGYNIQVRNNMLFGTDPDLPAARDEVGIFIQQGDAIVDGNILEGFATYGIQAHRMALNNIRITNNYITEFTGSVPIYFESFGTGYKISGNTIYNITATVSISAAIGILVTSQYGAISEIEVCDNQIYDNDNCVATASITGIYAYGFTNAINRLKITGNKVFIINTSVTPVGIGVDGSDTGIAGLLFGGNDLSGTTTSPYVRSNTANLSDERYIFDATLVSLTDADATPSVLLATSAKTGTTGLTITALYDGVPGQTLTILSRGAIVFDTTANARLTGSTVDITTASGDVTNWLCAVGGTTSSVWRLIGWTNAAIDNS